MKKLLMLILSVFSAGSILFAGDVSFIADDAEFHDDFFGGFAPFYLRGGIDYSGIDLLDGQSTNLFIVGGGAIYTSELWTDQSGIPFTPSDINRTALFTDYNSYSKWQVDFSLKLRQGFLERDFLFVYAGYGFHWTSPHENWKDDSAYSNFLSGDSAVYPDQAGAAVNTLRIGAGLDGMIEERKGWIVDASVLSGPRWFLNDLRGDSNFVNINLTASGVYPLPDLKQTNSGVTVFEVYLTDRIQLDYIEGDAIPEFYQEAPALGSKVRGFEENSMAVTFTAVNNLDFRMSLVGLSDKITPLFNLFLDFGYFAGEYCNTDYYAAGEFISAAGFELALNIFDVVQAGLSFGIPLLGTNLRNEEVQLDVMFSYHF